MTNTMKEILVVGAGPAGVSAALYAARAGAQVRVLYRDGGALEKAEKIENYYGFAQPVSGRELAENGIAGAKRLGVEFLRDEVVDVSWMDGFTVTGVQNTYPADAVILCTGAVRGTAPIEGLSAYEGSGVSYCAVCDAFFYRKKEVAVLGSGEYALHELRVLLPVVSRAVLLTNGEPLTVPMPPEVEVYPQKIAGVYGDGQVRGVTFADGSNRDVDGIFVARGVASGSALARKTGAAEENGKLVLDENLSTTVPGLYAAGDCTGGLLQVVKAVYEGARAGLSAAAFVRG